MVAIGGVVPTRHGVRLQDVDVTLEEVPSVKVHLDAVEVLYGTAGRRVVLHGGVVAAVGARDVVLRQADAWRSHHVAQRRRLERASQLQRRRRSRRVACLAGRIR